MTSARDIVRLPGETFIREPTMILGFMEGRLYQKWRVWRAGELVREEWVMVPLIDMGDPEETEA